MTSTLLRSFALCVALAAPALAQAQPRVEVQHPWVRATVAQQKATGAFMHITAGEPLRLVAASSPAAGVVEIHEMALVDQVMKMRAIAALDLPAGRPVALEPGGYHVMLLELKAPIKAGEAVPITLVFEDERRQRHSVPVSATARELAGGHGGSKPTKGQ